MVPITLKLIEKFWSNTISVKFSETRENETKRQWKKNKDMNMINDVVRVNLFQIEVDKMT